jgi:exodeoxyribonuclease VII small subunit
MAPEKNFEQAILELESIVNQLESGKLSLEETLKQFEHGMKLSQFCQHALNDAQKKVDSLKLDTPSNPSDSNEQ